MLKNLTIGKKLIIFFLLVGIIPLSVVGFMSYQNARSAMEVEEYAKLQAIAALKTGQINDFFGNALSAINAISKTNDIRVALSKLTKYHHEMEISATGTYDMSSSHENVTVPYDELYAEINKFLRVYPEDQGYYDIFIICKPHGHVMYTWAKEADLGANLSSGMYRNSGLAQAWEEAIAKNKGVITDTEPYAPSNGAPAQFGAAPIRDDSGAILGVVAVQLAQDKIDQIMQVADGMGNTGETYLVGKDMLFRSNSRLTNNETLLKVEVDTEGPQQAFRNKGRYEGIYGDYSTESEAKSGGRDYSKSLGGVPVLGICTYLPEQDWVLVCEKDETEAFAAVNKLKNSILVIGVVCAIIVGFIGMFTSKTITNPINKMVGMIKDIAQGEGDLTVRLAFETKDELGELSTWFDTFIAKLQDIMKQITNSSEQVGQVSSEISSAAEQMASGAEEQQSQLSEVASSMEQMSAMILEASKSAGSTQENANEANEAAQSGSDSVSQTINGIEGIATIVNSAAEQIKALEGRSQEIGDVIQVIDDIADQTNLLALNANIEAARAGDAGRGFAVVADEVRKLAERTVSATSDVGDQIKQIQNDVASSVKAMEQITGQANEGQKLAAASGTALGNITNSINGVNQAVTQIASAADQQSTGAEEISRNVESVSTVSKEAASSSQELASSAEELNRETQGLNDLIGQFKV